MITIAKKSPWGTVILDGDRLHFGDLPGDSGLPAGCNLPVISAGQLLAFWVSKPPLRPALADAVRQFAAQELEEAHSTPIPPAAPA
jgi:hypothetical protein